MLCGFTMETEGDPTQEPIPYRLKDDTNREVLLLTETNTDMVESHTGPLDDDIPPGYYLVKEPGDSSNWDAWCPESFTVAFKPALHVVGVAVEVEVLAGEESWITAVKLIGAVLDPLPFPERATVMQMVKTHQELEAYKSKVQAAEGLPPQLLNLVEHGAQIQAVNVGPIDDGEPGGQYL